MKNVKLIVGLTIIALILCLPMLILQGDADASPQDTISSNSSTMAAGSSDLMPHNQVDWIPATPLE